MNNYRKSLKKEIRMIALENELSYKDIAEILELKQGTVRQYLALNTSASPLKKHLDKLKEVLGS